MFQQARVRLAKTLGHIFISPFGPVRFRDFFLADVLTSTITPIQMSMIVYCYFIAKNQYGERDWKQGDTVNWDTQCTVPHKIYTTLGFIPYWWRFAQCLNKRRSSGQNVHLINAGKYFSCIMWTFAALWYHKYDYNTAFYIWLSIHLVSSAYAYAWDIYMDWGLLRSKSPGKYALRDRITYPQNFYYFAMVTDFILRFFWIVPIFKMGDAVFNNY